jgi:riboflavin kinase/FMN adenylyltransferase
MQVWNDLKHQGQKLQGASVTIGNFDGLHVGHQTLLAALKQGPAPRVVITFDPHPIQILYPDRALKRLLPRQDLVEQLPKYDIDVLWTIPFSTEFAKLTATDFLHRFVAEPFAPKYVVAGYDFGFGKGREGQLDTLRAWCSAQGCQLNVVSAQQVQQVTVSSRLLRELLAKGDVEQVQLYLRRPFYLRGAVIKGEGRGRLIGVPTLNQKVENETLPAAGVYITQVLCKGTLYPAVTNIGINPTFHAEGAVKVESHLLVPCSLTTGDRLDVQLIKYLRPEQRFASVEDLKNQIGSDILKAKQHFGII